MYYHPNLNPVMFNGGFFKIYWYGVMYLIGFIIAYYNFYLRRKSLSPNFVVNDIFDLLSYVAAGIIVGGRLGYVLFYDLNILLANPLSLINFWEPGRSFHGALIGAAFGLWVYSYNQKRSFLQLSDFIIPIVPIGLAAGRIGNFINGELWGRVTDVPWAMVFKNADNFPRHPSQLYEVFLEGIFLYVLINVFSKKKSAPGYLTGLFLVSYGLLRIFVEFYREPDGLLGFIILNWVTMGQLLSLPMIFFGIILMRKK